jgi:hypothetical protein
MVQGKHQIPTKLPRLPQAGMTKSQNIKENDLGDLDLTFVIYLGFKICNLGFNGMSPARKGTTLKFQGTV